jgi:hypothetical protein
LFLIQFNDLDNQFQNNDFEIILNSIGDELKWIYFDGNPIDDDAIDILKDYVYKNPLYPTISITGSILLSYEFQSQK